MKFSARIRKPIVVALSTMMVVMMLAVIVVPAVHSGYWKYSPVFHCETHAQYDEIQKWWSFDSRCCSVGPIKIECLWQTKYWHDDYGQDHYEGMSVWCPVGGCSEH